MRNHFMILSHAGFLLLGSLVLSTQAHAAPCADGDDYRTCNLQIDEVRGCKTTKSGSYYVCHSQPGRPGTCKIDTDAEGKNKVVRYGVVNGVPTWQVCRYVLLRPKFENRCLIQVNSCPFLSDGKPVRTAVKKNKSGTAIRKFVSVSMNDLAFNDPEDLDEMTSQLDEIVATDEDEEGTAELWNYDKAVANLVTKATDLSNATGLPHTFDKDFVNSSSNAALPVELQSFQANKGAKPVVFTEAAPSGTADLQTYCEERVSYWQKFCTHNPVRFAYTRVSTTNQWGVTTVSFPFSSSFTKLNRTLPKDYYKKPVMWLGAPIIRNGKPVTKKVYYKDGPIGLKVYQAED